MRLEARQITDSVGVVTSKTTSNDLTFERGWSFPVLLTPLVGNRFYDSCIPSLRLLFFPIVLLTSYHLPVEQALTKIFSTGTAANFLHQLFVLSSFDESWFRKETKMWCRSKSWGKEAKNFDLLWYISCYYHVYYIVSKDFFKNFIILTYTTLVSLYYKTLCYRCILFILERLNFRLKFYNFYLHPVYKLLSYYTYCKNIFRSKNEGTS